MCAQRGSRIRAPLGRLGHRPAPNSAGPVPRLAFAPHVSEPAPITYKDAGVDIAAQDAALGAAKDAVRATFTPGVAFTLKGGFPPKPLDNESLTLADAKLLNETIVQSTA